MVQISRKKLPEETLTKLFTLFFQTLGQKYDKNQFNDIINDLFSETEQVMIIKRIAIVYLLLKEINKQMISEGLSVSQSTICRFSPLVKNQKGLAPYLKQLVKTDKVREFIDNAFGELFDRPGQYGVHWKSAWQRKFARDRRKLTGI